MKYKILSFLVIASLVNCLIFSSSYAQQKEEDKAAPTPSGQREIILIGPNGQKMKMIIPNTNQIPNLFLRVEDDKNSDSTEQKDSHKKQFFIGVTLESIPEGFHELMGIKKGQGLFISGLIDESPASQAGIQKFDVLLEMNSQPVSSSAMKFKQEIQNNGEKPIKMKLRRMQKEIELEVTPKVWTDMNENFQSLFLDVPILQQPIESYNLQDFLPEHLKEELNKPMDWPEGYDQEEKELKEEVEELHEELREHQAKMMKMMEELKKQIEEISK